MSLLKNMYSPYDVADDLVDELDSKIHGPS